MGGLNMSGRCIACEEKPAPPRVVVVGLASCFGCQLQITNAESHLLDVLGQIDLRYWQLASSDPMPEDFDVAVIEGAVTTEESENLVRALRERAAKLMASVGFLSRPVEVYGEGHVPAACGEMISPRPVSAVVDVDYEVRCCPIDTLDFVDVLQAALFGSNRMRRTATMCGDCKRNETNCFFGEGTLCLGLVTTAGCGARCVSLGRPCNGCRGLSPDANLASARAACGRYGVPVNQTDPALEGAR